MNRRRLLQLAAALAGATLAPGSASASARRIAISPLFADPALLAALGERCKTQLPTQTKTLLTLAGLAQPTAAPDVADAQALLRQFAAKRRADFRHGRILNVDGWLLAEAEGALCALLAAS